MPFTFLTMLMGSLALAGFPLWSGFWSKDEIIHHAFALHPALGVVGLVTAALTAFYTFRMMFLAFWGPERIPEGVTAHESGKWILAPLGVLALGAVFAGYAGVHVEAGGFLGFLEPGGAFHRFLEPVMAPFAAQHVAEAGQVVAESSGVWAALVQNWMMYLSALIAILGILVAYVFYVRRPWIPQLFRSTFPEAYRVLWNKYFVDEAYDAAVVKPLRRTGVACYRIDEFFIDGIIWVITAIPRLIGFACRALQRGALQGYGLSMAAGLAIIVVLAMLA